VLTLVVDTISLSLYIGLLDVKTQYAKGGGERRKRDVCGWVKNEKVSSRPYY